METGLARGSAARVELFNLAEDQSETTNLADKHPEKVTEMQARILSLANEMAPPLLLMEAVKLTFGAPLVTADPTFPIRMM